MSEPKTMLERLTFDELTKLTLGERMKWYEYQTRTSIDPTHYIIIRVDGKAFHTYTKNMQKPWDQGIINNMIDTTKYLCEHVPGCVFGYTQSDEISLLLAPSNTPGWQPYFNGQVQKIVSVVASMAAAKFFQCRLFTEYNEMKNKEVFFNETFEYFEKPELAHFDARVFSMDCKDEVVRYFMWRQRDAIRNSVQALAQHMFKKQGQKFINKKNTDELKQMLKEAYVNELSQLGDWDTVEIYKQRGTGIRKRIGLWRRKQDVEVDAMGCKFHMDYVGTFIEDVTDFGGESYCDKIMKANGFYVRKKWKPDFEIPIFEDNWDYIQKLL